jgi:group I intron endonuclease
MAYIYKTTNIKNGKIYIGQSKKTKEKSTNYMGSGKLLKEAISEFGKDCFIKEIVEDIDNLDHKYIDEREQYWISYYNSTDLTIGYNTTKGGSGWSSFGIKRSEETKRKQSEKRKGKKPWNNGLKNPYTKEQIQKMLDNRLTKSGWKNKQKFIWVCPEGSFEKRIDVAKIYNVTPRMITIWCNDPKKTEFMKLKKENDG